MDLEDELTKRQDILESGQSSDRRIEGGDRSSEFALDDADPTHCVRIFDVVETGFRIERQVKHGQIRSKVFCVNCWHLDRLPSRCLRSTRVGTLSSGENYMMYNQPCGYARNYTPEAPGPRGRKITVLAQVSTALCVAGGLSKRVRFHPNETTRDDRC